MNALGVQLKILVVGLHLCFAALSFSAHCDARRSMHLLRSSRRHHHHQRSSSAASIIIRKPTKRIQVSNYLDLVAAQLDATTTSSSSSNTQPYGVSAPFSMPPYDSLAPVPLPENAPPFCVYPPFTPLPPPPPSPSSIIPPPAGNNGGGNGNVPLPPSSFPPPSTPLFPTPPGSVPSPPESFPSPNSPQVGVPSPFPNPPPPAPSPPTLVPSPTEPVLSPPYFEPSPPYFEPSPPGSVVPTPPFSNVPLSPPTFVPSPPVFHPPVVYPPPSVPPPPRKSPNTALWCVVKPTVPDPIIQEAMNYACGSGADCDSIQPNGSCFQPNTLLAHASYAFNSYWQRTKVAGGTCEFGGAAMLVTVDPSYDGCHFLYY